VRCSLFRAANLVQLPSGRVTFNCPTRAPSQHARIGSSCHGACHFLDAIPLAPRYGMLDPNIKDKEGLPLTCRAVFIVGPDKKLKLSLNYPASVGRNMDEIVRVVDALQLSAKYSVVRRLGIPMLGLLLCSLHMGEACVSFNVCSHCHCSEQKLADSERQRSQSYIIATVSRPRNDGLPNVA